MAARDIQFVIRAKDEASRAFESIVSAIEEFAGVQADLKSGSGVLNRDLSSLAQTLSQFDKLQKAVFSGADNAGQAFQRQAAKVESLKSQLASLKAQAAGAQRAMSEIKGAAAATGGEADATKIKAIEAAQTQLQRAISRVTSEIGKEEAALSRVVTEYQRISSLANAVDATAPQVGNAQASLAEAQATRQRAEAAARLRDMINPLAAAEANHAAKIRELNELERAGAITAKERTAAERMFNQELKDAQRRSQYGENGVANMLGLKPYQMVNLTYQVNDIVSGIAMGQKPAQIIAQQFGQLVQIFPQLQTKMMALFTNPYFLGAAAVLTPFVIALHEAANEAERLRQFEGVLKANADGARYSAAALEANVEALKHYHLSAEDAVAITRILMKEGLDGSKLTAFGMAAKDMSRVMGVDVKDAAQQLATAFTGGYAAVAKLDDEFNFLTASERQHIRTLMEQGKIVEAQTEAFGKLRDRMHDGAQEMRGPWTRAVEALADAWKSFIEFLSHNSVIQTIAGSLELLGLAAEHLFKSLDQGGGSGGGVQSKLPETADVKAQIEEAQKMIAAYERLEKKNAGNDTLLPLFQREKAQWQERLDQLQRQSTAENNAADKRYQDTKDQLDLEMQMARATSDADRIRMAGEKAYRDYVLETNGKIDERIAKLKRERAEQMETMRIQRDRRSDLMSTAQSFVGRREDNRNDRAALTGFFNAAGIQAPGGGALDPEKVAWCAAFVNAVLFSKGVPGTGSLAAKSFNNFGTSTAQPEEGDIVIIKGGTHVGFFKGFDQNGNVRVLGGNQGKEGHASVNVSTFKRSAVADFRRIPNIGEGVQGLDSEVQHAIQLNEQQDQFNHGLETEAANRALALKYLREQLGLSAKELFDSQRKQAIEEAITQAERQAKDNKDGALELSEKQKQTIAEQVGAQFDLEHAEGLVNDQLREQQDLREALLRGIQDAAARGDDSTVAQLQAALEQMQPAMDAAITAAENFWKQFNTPEAKAALENLRHLRQEVADTATQILKAKLDRVGQRIGGMEDLQGALQSAVDQAQLSGDRSGARAAEEQLTGLTASLMNTRNEAIAMWQAIASNPEALAALGMTAEQVQAVVLGLQQANQEASAMSRQFLMTGRQINESLADMGTNALDNFFKDLVETRDLIGSLWRMFVQFAADFLRQIGMMIVKQALFNMLSNKSQSGGGGIGGAISGAVGSLFATAAPLTAAGGVLAAAGGTLTGAATALGINAAQLMASAQMLMVANSMGSFAGFHGGGIAGTASMSFTRSPAVFAGAIRYHTGGLAGLRPDEVPAILQRGEEILTKSDPRHRRNQGLEPGGGSPGGIRQVLAIGDEEIAKAALGGTAGDRLLVTWLKRNKTTVRQVLDS